MMMIKLIQKDAENLYFLYLMQERNMKFILFALSRF